MDRFEKPFEHKQELQEAALKEFNKKGYSKASLSGILKTAKMSKGSFYYHFKNKEDLYFGLIEVLINKKKAFLTENVKPAMLEKDIFTILKYQMKVSIKFANRYPEIGKFSERFIKEKGNAIYQKALKKYNFMNNDALKPLIDASHQRGEFREDLPPEFVSNMIGYFLTHAVEITQMSKTDDYEENINHLIDFLKNGLERKEQLQ
ncbi:MAG: TetR/AcrR family transcriptional regulator [Candidatus Bathyarchaeota archaeon]|nr:TetR/AcrR family transcriptional regulator [Candidatus Bathyarchaeota archaeon]